MGGFSGEDQLSPLLVKNLLTKLTKFSKDTDVKYLLDNHRLLLIPSINVEGQFNQRYEELSEDQTLVNIEQDFNFGIESDQKCFKSSSSRLLAHVFKVTI